MLHRLSSLVALVCCASVGLSAAADAADWTRPHLVSDTRHNNRDPWLASAADGFAVSVFDRHQRTYQPDSAQVMVRQRTAGGHWRDLRRASGAVEYSFGSRVAVDGDGDAVIAWNGRADALQAVFARRLSRSGTLGPIRRVSTAGVDSATLTGLSIDGAGNALVTWREQRDHPAYPMLRRLSAGGGMDAPVLLDDVAAESDPVVVQNRAGAGLVAWGNDGTVRATRTAPDGSLGPVQQVGQTVDLGGPVDVTPYVDDTGAGMVIWRQPGADVPSVLQAARIVAGGEVAPQSQLTPGRNASEFHAVMAPDGDLRLLWSGGEYGDSVYTRNVPVSGSPGPVERLTDHRGYFRVGIAPDGAGLLVWGVSIVGKEPHARWRRLRADHTLAATTGRTEYGNGQTLAPLPDRGWLSVSTGPAGPYSQPVHARILR